MSISQLDEAVGVYPDESKHVVTRRVDGSTRRVELVFMRIMRKRGDSMSCFDALKELGQHGLLTMTLTMVNQV